MIKITADGVVKPTQAANAPEKPPLMKPILKPT